MKPQTQVGPNCRVQSKSFVHVNPPTKQVAFDQQMHGPPPTCGAHPQPKGGGQGCGFMQSKGGQLHPEAANAGVRMLVRMGAVQTTAAPAPIRLSILRRESRSGAWSEFMAPPGCV